LNSEFEIDPNLLLPGFTAEPETQEGEPPPVTPKTSFQEDETERIEDQEREEPVDNEQDREQEPKAETAPEAATSKPSSASEPSLIERYAWQRGFHWRAGEKRYTHANGGWIEKSSGPFNWEERAADRNLLYSLVGKRAKARQGYRSRRGALVVNQGKSIRHLYRSRRR